MKQTLLAWCRLLRLPNVLTVPGDVLAGAALAGLAFCNVLRPVGAVMLAYLFGMALNDVWDMKADRLDRPERPLPSGDIPRNQAVLVCVLLGAGALAVHFTPAMGVLVGLIIAYTALKQQIPVLGLLLMGLCRGAAVWIGAGAPLALSPPLFAAIVLWVVYIAAVTALAAFETGKPMGREWPWVMPMILNLGFLAMAYTVPSPSPWAYLPGLAAFVLVNLHARDMVRAKQIRPSDIGRLIGLLFFMQAFVLALHGHITSAAIILALAPAMRWARKRVPAS
jgi:4-hydroxybenzoate polyprenyltransferase